MPRRQCGPAHRQQDEVGALVAEAHDREADDTCAGPRHQRYRVRVTDQRRHARRPIGPAQTGFDQVARHQRERIRVARLGESEFELLDSHDADCAIGRRAMETERFDPLR